MAQGLETLEAAAFLSGGGEAGAMMRAHDWSATPLGSPDRWPLALRVTLGIMLRSPESMFIAYGPELRFFFNDAYRPILGPRLPHALGAALPQLWADVWEQVRPIVEKALAGEASRYDDLPLTMARHGEEEQTWWSFSYSPLVDENGAVVGLLCITNETTRNVLARREAAIERQRQRLMLQQMPGFVALLTGPEHRFDYVNDAYVRISGARDSLGRTVREVFPELAEQGFHDLLDQVYASGESFAGRAMPVHLDGEEAARFVDFLYDPIRDDDGAVAGIFVGGYEVTEAQSARDDLSASAARQEFRLSLEERLRDLADPAQIVAAAAQAVGRHIDAAEVGYAEVDASGDHADTLAAWTSGSPPRFGSGRFHLKDFGRHVPDLRAGRDVVIADITRDPRTSPPDALAAYAAMAIGAFVKVPLIKSGRFAAYLYAIEAGPRQWTDADIDLLGDVVQRVWAAVERVRAQALLRESEERNRRIIEGVRDHAIFVVDAAGTVVDWTPGAAAVFGWAAGDILGKSADLLFTPEDRADDVPARELAKARDTGCAGDEGWHMRKDGTRFFANGSVRPLHDSKGDIAGFIKIARDETERRAFEARLRASEEFTRRILESSADCIKVLDLDARLEFMSEGGMGVMEVDDFKAIEGQCWPEFWKGPEHQHALDAVERARAGGTGRFQGFAPTAKGTPRWWDVIVTPMAGPDGRPEKLLSISRDVTTTKEAEVRLSLSEARYRTLFEAIDVGFCIVEMKFDDEGRAVDYRLAEINPAFEKQTGLRGAAGKWASEAAPGLERHWFDSYGAVAKTGEPARFENRAEPFGRWYDVHAFRTGAAHEHRVAILFNDITARKAAEDRLRELNETLEQRVAQRTQERDRLWVLSEDMMARADYAGGLSAVNPAWTKVLGWSEHKLMTDPYADIIHPDDVETVAAALDEMSRTGQPTRFANRIRTADGAWKPIGWTVAPEPDGVNFIAVGRDLTDDKEREAELLQAQEALRQSQKMEAMGQLTGGVAHDFNNLLTPIIGSLDMLQRRQVGGEREQRLINGALQSADRAKTLVQRLLAFARRQPLKATAIDLGRLLEGMAELVASTSGPQIDVVVHAADDLQPACADPNQLEMAILNLAVNARDAMPHGGTLTLSAGEAAIGPGHRSRLAPGNYVSLCVADTGAGMDAATLARAIEPFFSTKGIGKGTGLGLSMVHGLASQLGGAMTLASRVGLGTKVELWLPVSAVPAAEESGEPTPAPSPAAAGLVLLVDDEDNVRASTADMLGDLGYRVVEAVSAADALRLLDGGLEPDLLLTDHLMPGMTGTDLAREVRGRWPDRPVLIISGFAEADSIAPDLPRLTKPFRQAELSAMLATLA